MAGILGFKAIDPSINKKNQELKEHSVGISDDH
jgi:hypothetical protein